MAKNNEKNYLDALRDLRSYISREFKKGGWLPPSRKLSEQFKVSRMTYRKALRCLEKDNTVRAYPKKGHYVNPEFLRVKKIGLIVCDAGDSPFLRNGVIEAILTRLTRDELSAQVIQAYDYEGILDKALIHGVQGLIWAFPQEDSFDHIKNIHLNSNLPIVAVTPDQLRDDLLDDELPCVIHDYAQGARDQADFFLDRGHKKVMYIARTDEENSSFDCFSRQMRAAGGEAVFAHQDVNGQDADLSSLSCDSTITGLAMGGGSWDAYRVFENLSKLNNHALRDLYVHYMPELAAITSMFPSVIKTGIGKADHGILGKAAADLLLRNLYHGTRIVGKKINIFKIEEVQK